MLAVVLYFVAAVDESHHSVGLSGVKLRDKLAEENTFDDLLDLHDDALLDGFGVLRIGLLDLTSALVFVLLVDVDEK